MVILQGREICEIRFPRIHQDILLSHCYRKLNNIFIPGETQERKAYGMICGRIEEHHMVVEFVAPLSNNARSQGAEKEYMDGILSKYAIPSETPLDKRAWVADPLETKNIINYCRKNRYEMLGTYHMHRVSWKGDSKREKPTELDTVLGKDSELVMFIVSVIDQDKPVIRSFYEGYPDQEIPIV